MPRVTQTTPPSSSRPCPSPTATPTSASCESLDLSSEVFTRHPLTTEEVLENCRDLKVLGERELERLLKRRRKMRQFVEEVRGSEGRWREGGGWGRRRRRRV